MNTPVFSSLSVSNASVVAPNHFEVFLCTEQKNIKACLLQTRSFNGCLSIVVECFHEFFSQRYLYITLPLEMLFYFLFSPRSSLCADALPNTAILAESNHVRVYVADMQLHRRRFEIRYPITNRIRFTCVHFTVARSCQTA